MPQSRRAMYAGLALGLACFFSPFGWGATHPPLPSVNMALSLGLFVMVGIVGIRTVQSWWHTATFLRWPMILLALCLVAGTAVVGAESLWMQQTSMHYQWMHHKKVILIVLGILAGCVLQELIRKRIEKKQPTTASTVPSEAVASDGQ